MYIEFVLEVELFSETMCSKTWFWMITFIYFDVIRYIEPAQLRCYKSSIDDYITTPFTKAIDLIGSPCIDLEKPTVFYTFGYRGLATGPATTAVINGYLATKKRNVILVDWQTEAKSGAYGIPLGYALSAVPNAKKVGEEFGHVLVTLARAGLNMTQLQLVGHSLGAHLLCYSGRTARKGGYILQRLIALDPARALFEGRFTLNSGVDRTCAKSVVVIHTDPGNYGLKQPVGTADFYPNFAGLEARTLQPSCKAGDFEMFTHEDLCSHDCSWRYLVESLSRPTAFIAVRAESYGQWLARDFNDTDTVYMGELTSSRARGTYYLTTNASQPYGAGSSGIYPGAQITRKRRNPILTNFGSLLRFLR